MNKLNLQLVMLILVGVGVSVTSYMFRLKRLNHYWARKCTGTEWRKQFPDATKNSIREFLECFVDGFAFSSKNLLKFSPNDEIMEVYRALYPTKGWPDTLELETFSLNLEKKYGIDFASAFDEDLTLGQLFKVVRGMNPDQDASPDR